MRRNECSVIPPVLLVRAGRESSLEHAQRDPKLTVVNTVEGGTPGMMPSRLGPLLKDARKVAHIEPDHAAILAGSKSEEIRITPAVQSALLICRPHLMTGATQRFGYTPPGSVSHFTAAWRESESSSE